MNKTQDDENTSPFFSQFLIRAIKHDSTHNFHHSAYLYESQGYCISQQSMEENKTRKYIIRTHELFDFFQEYR